VGLPACDLHQNGQSAATLAAYMQRLLQPNVWLDCCVKAYNVDVAPSLSVAPSGYATTSTATAARRHRIFGTSLVL
jgi:hypothetical protein